LVFAKEKLSEPECESLLAHASWAVEQETRRQRSGFDRLGEAGLEIFVTKQSDKRHS
jgi:hypothetical protein